MRNDTRHRCSEWFPLCPARSWFCFSLGAMRFFEELAAAEMACIVTPALLDAVATQEQRGGARRHAGHLLVSRSKMCASNREDAEPVRA